MGSYKQPFINHTHTKHKLFYYRTMFLQPFTVFEPVRSTRRQQQPFDCFQMAPPMMLHMQPALYELSRQMATQSTPKNSKSLVLGQTRPENLKIMINQKTNMIKVEAKSECMQERNGTKFSSKRVQNYSFSLPAGADASSIKSKLFKNGRLEFNWQPLHVENGKVDVPIAVENGASEAEDSGQESVHVEETDEITAE